MWFCHDRSVNGATVAVGGGGRAGRFDSQLACQGGGGFTLVEMLAVIVVIAILASMMAVGVNQAKERARQADCMSNLRQFGTALVTFRADNGGRNPGWLSNLYPTYLDDKGVYVCRSDPNHGRGTSRPATIPPFKPGYDSTLLDDNVSNPRRAADAHAEIEACSYFYEFSSAPSPWAVPDKTTPTWQDFKEWELLEGNGGPGKPCSSSRMPIIRCYHHARFGTIDEFPPKQVGDWQVPDTAASPRRTGLTLNVAYAGNVVVTPLWWQGAVGASDRR